ncbi:cell wall hydrolase [Falsibacillus albus]|uniref:LysM peptidoglycan-binding domain-containing protein n=1 Tax=Falsibacillus albus TaxID=2478915 RepID=A0A3L7K8V4_9BACI|nr:cell wall hydrolase [Falsibacillus albus]RLQ97092.1 LysM peptidoglycan-binding domain-containing protein [Falsibacillus albus]
MRKQKTVKSFVIATLLGAGLFTFHHGQADAAQSNYTVKKGDSLWKIGKKYGVPAKELKSVNNLDNSMIYPNETLKLPSQVSEADKELLAKLVTAEAKGEPYAGQVAVATVVLNRVDSDQFPDSIHSVIYQDINGHYAFSPVENGQINQPAKPSAVKAVDEALKFRGKGNGSLFFYNPETSTSKWIFSTQETVTIGHHRFAK